MILFLSRFEMIDTRSFSNCFIRSFEFFIIISCSLNFCCSSYFNSVFSSIIFFFSSISFAFSDNVCVILSNSACFSANSLSKRSLFFARFSFLKFLFSFSSFNLAIESVVSVIEFSSLAMFSLLFKILSLLKLISEFIFSNFVLLSDEIFWILSISSIICSYFNFNSSLSDCNLSNLLFSFLSFSSNIILFS